MAIEFSGCVGMGWKSGEWYALNRIRETLRHSDQCHSDQRPDRELRNLRKRIGEHPSCAIEFVDQADPDLALLNGSRADEPPLPPARMRDYGAQVSGAEASGLVLQAASDLSPRLQSGFASRGRFCDAGCFALRILALLGDHFPEHSVL